MTGRRRSGMSLRDVRRYSEAVDVRAGVYRLAGHIGSLHPSSREDGSWTVGVLHSTLPHPVGFVANGLGGLIPGHSVELEGYWDEHPEYGVQYHVDRVLSSVVPGASDHLVAYMEYHIARIGRARARALIRAFGSNVLEVLERDPDIPKQIFPGRVGEAISHGVRSWLRNVESERWCVDVAPALMQAGGIGYPFARRICAYFSRAEVADLVLRRDPYRLLEVPGVGWTRADGIARSMGYSEGHPERLAGAVMWAARQRMEQGHTAHRRSELIAATTKLVSGPKRVIGRAIAQLCGSGDMLRAQGLLYSEDALAAEWSVADLVRWLRVLDRTLRRDEIEVVNQVVAASKLTPTQSAAVLMALTNGVSVLTGRPGTGKTTTLQVLLKACRHVGLQVTIAAPTGKAAARAKDVTGEPTVTVHKLLGGPPGSDREGGPIRHGLLVIDEASMLDLEVCAWLAANIRPSSSFRLLFVGDQNQLASVRHGQILADLIASQMVPTTELTEVQRRAADSNITAQAHRLLDGIPLDLSEYPDFRVLRLVDEPVAAQRQVLREVSRVVREEESSLVRRALKTPFDAKRDLQVLTPRNGGPLGTAELNPLLRQRLNPKEPAGPFIAGDTRVSVGDRVVCTINDYTIGESGLMNGEQGVVQNALGNTITVLLDDGRVVRTEGPVQNGVLSLSFATSVHRSQGSEYPVVLVVFHSSQFPLVERRLLYTAITRAKCRVILCADSRALETAYRIPFGVVRTTGLSRLLEG